MYKIFLALFIGACYLSTLDHSNKLNTIESLGDIATNLLIQTGNQTQAICF